MCMQVRQHQWQPSWQLLPKLQRLVLFVRYLLTSGAILVESLVTVLTVIAVLSILVGNLLAVRQVRQKRILVIHQLHTLAIYCRFNQHGLCKPR